MAIARLSDPIDDLNHQKHRFLENLTREQLKDCLAVSFSQLSSLVQVAMGAEFNQHSEGIVYDYLAVLDDRLADMKALCDRLWFTNQACAVASCDT